MSLTSLVSVLDQCVLTDAVPTSFTALQEEIGLDVGSTSALIMAIKVLKSGYLFHSIISLLASLFHREVNHSGNLASNF